MLPHEPQYPPRNHEQWDAHSALTDGNCSPRPSPPQIPSASTGKSHQRHGTGHRVYYTVPKPAFVGLLPPKRPSYADDGALAAVHCGDAVRGSPEGRCWGPAALAGVPSGSTVHSEGPRLSHRTSARGWGPCVGTGMCILRPPCDKRRTQAPQGVPGIAPLCGL